MPEDYEIDPVDLWPENEQAITLFCSVSSQWRVGAGGAIGLDYSVLFARMERMQLTEDRHEQLFEEIRVIEAEALDHINKKTDP